MTVLCTICGKLIPEAEADTHCEAVHGEGGWRDIATAPKDGTIILGQYGEFSDYGLVRFYNGKWVDQFCDEEWDEPQLWQPLPPPPKVSK
jgi:hypothetical protein